VVATRAVAVEVEATRGVAARAAEVEATMAAEVAAATMAGEVRMEDSAGWERVAMVATAGIVKVAKAVMAGKVVLDLLAEVGAAMVVMRDRTLSP